MYNIRSSHINVTTTYFRRQREITNHRRQVDTVQWSVYKGCPRASESISIVGVMQKRSDLSEVQKGMIIGFRVKGGSISETANFVNCSRAAVVKVYCACERCCAWASAADAWLNGCIYQQDNARCPPGLKSEEWRTAPSVCPWIEEHQDEFTVLPWPANSPDLNTIENLRDHLDRVVRAMDPQPHNLAQLATALESVWLNIPVNTFRNLIDSLPARLAVVRSAKGGYSGF
ncbi:hypothetical protein AVEN_136055-1 [Araneus ventricosus]|uniref:Tc1-like transposase DDE domain-containing protein n=1 Tax=Araneus ventricosus TaxID=182803 RepID=A0A4Y2QJ79_ARAVE|nr:hypothetical protein AVEN_136055-1 [Araneus ventricosus]